MRMVLAILSLAAIGGAEAGEGFYMPGFSNEQLLTKTKAEQQSVLATAVENAQGVREKHCGNPAIVFLKKSVEGSGYWNVACEKGGEYLVLFPAQATKAAVSLHCTISKAIAKIDCRTAERLP
jgi:hypothetical protein